MSYSTLEGDVLDSINFILDVKGNGSVGDILQGTIEADENTSSMFIIFMRESVDSLCRDGHGHTEATIHRKSPKH